MTEPSAPAYHEDAELFQAALTFTQSETGFSSRLVEKDYYCSLVLHDLLGVRAADLAFKGGTSLSKVHADFYRLSEDLDFGISTPESAPRGERSKKVARFKARLAGLPTRLPCFRIVAPFRGFNNSTQYSTTLSYRSLITGQDEFIKVEISVREPIVEAVAQLPVKTLLLDPFRLTAAVAPFPTAVLSCREAYAEKFRAALTRRDPAIRDFYDVAYAFRAGRIEREDKHLIELVARKLAIPGNEPIDVSQQKLEVLRKQVEMRLKPVLKTSDFASFDLDDAFAVVRSFAKPFLSK